VPTINFTVNITLHTSQLLNSTHRCRNDAAETLH